MIRFTATSLIGFPKSLVLYSTRIAGVDRDKALELLRGGREGVREWNTYRRSGGLLPALIDADLHGADLEGADLTKADLTHSILNEAKLNGANLGGAVLKYAKLVGADISSANLSSPGLSPGDGGMIGGGTACGSSTCGQGLVCCTGCDGTSRYCEPGRACAPISCPEPTKDAGGLLTCGAGCKKICEGGDCGCDCRMVMKTGGATPRL